MGDRVTAPHPPSYYPAASEAAFEVIQTAPPSPALNPSGRDVYLGGPLKDGPFILGEVSYLLTADARIQVDVDPLLDLLQPVISPASWQALASALAGRQRVSTVELTRAEE